MLPEHSLRSVSVTSSTNIAGGSQNDDFCEKLLVTEHLFEEEQRYIKGVLSKELEQ
jgi:hypothetical protein